MRSNAGAVRADQPAIGVHYFRNYSELANIDRKVSADELASVQDSGHLESFDSQSDTRFPPQMAAFKIAMDMLLQ